MLREILVSIVVSIPACHAGDRGSIPRRGGLFLIRNSVLSALKDRRSISVTPMIKRRAAY